MTSRRGFITAGLAGFVGIAAAGAGVYELVESGTLPGKYRLDEMLGACDVSVPRMRFAQPGPSLTSTFFSHFRRRQVGYTIAYPPNHGPGSRLPLVVLLHGWGGSHETVSAGTTMAQLAALEVGGRVLTPLALVAADGGNGYWTPHPGDDPFGMIVHELIPLCRRLGLGLPGQAIATMGVSMGGYGALLFAEKVPRLIRVAAAISPAIWTTYDQARSANPSAYASARTFAANDVVTHADVLAGAHVRVAAGLDDPFLPGVRALIKVLPPNAVTIVSRGCHSGTFFESQEPASLAFIARHIP